MSKEYTHIVIDDIRYVCEIYKRELDSGDEWTVCSPAVDEYWTGNTRADAIHAAMNGLFELCHRTKTGEPVQVHYAFQDRGSAKNRFVNQLLEALRDEPNVRGEIYRIAERVVVKRNPEMGEM